MQRMFILFFCLAGLLSAQDKSTNPEITPEEIKAHIYYLASDAMRGRFTGSPEERKAGNYIKSQFQSAGLKPLFNGKWFQEFPFIERVEMTKKNSLSFQVANKKKSLKAGKDYTAISFSGNGKLSADVVFAGYGISLPSGKYDDYAGLDVKGKIVLIMRNHPEHDSSRSEFDRFASLRNKANNAKDKGAIGLVLVDGYTPKNDDLLIEMNYDGAPGMKDFAVLQVKREVADKLLKSIDVDFAEVQKNIDASKKPNSFPLKNMKASLQTEVKEIKKIARNVGGIFEGIDVNLKNEYIVIGGHYDHLGVDQLKNSSMYKGKEKLIHNGADDNASGTTGVLEVAEKFGSVKDKIKRSIIFLAFSGEELGILGSTYFTNNPPVDINRISAMLNMDMIGRLNTENNLTIIGTGTSSKWKDLLNANNSYGLKLAFSDGGSGGSDHQAFSNKSIPVLFFFTGTHSDYHKPSDDADKINVEGETRVAKFVFDIALAVDELVKKPDYVKVEEPANRGMGGGRTRVTVGTVPEFGYSGDGYKISGVTDGSPAAKAGMRAGDIIIKFGKKSIGNIYDFMYATQDYKAGDKVDVVVQRDGKELAFNLELVAK
jgi:aminopeptidase YwaD